MPRLLLLLPTTTYRTDAFVTAALRLDVDLVVASERDSAFSAARPEGLLTLDFRDPGDAAETVRAFAASRPVDAVFGVDDRTARVAAVVSEDLGLPHNPVEAVRAAGDKYRQRVVLRKAGVPVPDFSVHHVDQPVEAVLAGLNFPRVVKPLHLAASQGVIRAKDAGEFRDAHARLRRILEREEGRTHGAPPRFLVEAYVPGPEFALEGLVTGGALHVLALFDKPDPLAGPFFEETIYVTPSRAEPRVREALAACAGHAVTALGLLRGPVHVELRHNERGPWLIELAARPIGGRCGQVLRFGPAGERSLEEVLLAHALGLLREVPAREEEAAGVMMIPIPRAGVLREVRGIEEGRAVPHVTDIAITAHRGQRLVPLPEEARYLGFIFARAGEPGAVEAALREADARLTVVVE